jgi:hypothetical protein
VNLINLNLVVSNNSLHRMLDRYFVLFLVNGDCSNAFVIFETYKTLGATVS